MEERGGGTHKGPGGRRGRGDGGTDYNKRLTACKSCLTPELAPELSASLKKELGCSASWNITGTQRKGQMRPKIPLKRKSEPMNLHMINRSLVGS